VNQVFDMAGMRERTVKSIAEAISRNVIAEERIG
jgi:hypothetical protein